MDIVFRADASLDIGTGHVMRCLTLASARRERGARCTFVCRAHAGHMADRIRAAGYAVRLLPASTEDKRRDADKRPYESWLGCTQGEDVRATIAALGDSHYDWLVVDHYALNAIWEAALRPHVKHILAIDDLANRRHDCDLLLDQNLGREPDDYENLVAPGTTKLIGPRYALLRPEFAEWRDYSLRRRAHPRLRQLLISMGGIDKDNVTGKVLNALRHSPLPADCSITVVMGAHAPWLENVQAASAVFGSRCEVKVGARNMAEIMANSDVAIGAAGSSVWERCALGVPSIVVATAENQTIIARTLDHAEAARVADATRLAGDLALGVQKLMDAATLDATSKSAAAICDGRGTKRVVCKLLACGVVVRPMGEADLDQVLQWRNHPAIRRWMRNTHEIAHNEHREWYATAQRDPLRTLLIVEQDGLPLGFVQFVALADNKIADWGFYKVPTGPSGSGYTLGKAALGYAFTTLGLQEIRGETIRNNTRSQALHRKLGFAHSDRPPYEVTGRDGQQAIHWFTLNVDEWLKRDDT